MSAWLSLVGMPNTHASDDHVTMDTVAAARAMSATWASPPKSTMPLMVSATAVEKSVMPTSPRKLVMTLIQMAASTPMARVPMGSAIALAASVAPFTKMVPITSRITSAKNGLACTAERN